MSPTPSPPRSPLPPGTAESDGEGGSFSSKSAILLATLFGLFALVALWTDCRLSQWFIEVCPSEVKRLLQFCEVFGHGVGLLIVAVLIHQLDPARRWALPRVASIAAAAGLAADIGKVVVERIRPYHFDLEKGVWESFGGWLPMLAPSSHQSFPSGHTAMAVGLAMGLMWLYPRGRWLFPLFAVLVAFQRLASGSHYLSDVFAGAALGILMGVLFLKVSPIRRRFEQWELRWRSQ